MKEDKLIISIEQRRSIANMLQIQGLTESEINEIFNGEYTLFETPEEIQSMFENGKYGNVLSMLSDGYTMKEIEQSGISIKEVQEFNEMLNNNNWTVQNAKAIHQYTDGSNMILGIKRGEDRTVFKQKIIQQLKESLEQRGISQNKIVGIQRKIQEMDFQRPVYENYELINNYIKEQSLPNASTVSIRKAIQSMDRFEHIDETIEALDDGLSKTKLQNSVRLYRAVKSSSLKNLGKVQDLSELKGKTFQNIGQTSTSPLYESSFAKYDAYDAVFEIYAPKGTRGAYVTQLSDYGMAEQEVLLNPNDLYITDVQEIVDKNGRSKTILTALMLSKERECYIGIDKKQGEEQSQCEQASVSQNRSSRFFNPARKIFANQTNNRHKNRQKKTKESWDLEN